MIRAYLRNERGAAAIEFAMMLGVFTVSLPSVVDLGIYAYDQMQVQNSAQMGVQAIWSACTQLPATDTALCSTGQSAMNTAVQQTSLGNAVTVSSATEGYYCVGSAGALANAVSGNKTGDFTTALDASSNVPSPPTNCSNVTGSLTTTPGDYMSVTVTYTYSPVFSHASVASLLGTTISSTAVMRLQ